MASVNLFYDVKPCKEAIRIENRVKSCFDDHLIKDKPINRVMFKQSGFSDATHIQYLDKEGIIRIYPVTSRKTFDPSSVVNFRLIILSKSYPSCTKIKPYELDPETKSLLGIYYEHLIK